MSRAMAKSLTSLILCDYQGQENVHRISIHFAGRTFSVSTTRIRSDGRMNYRIEPRRANQPSTSRNLPACGSTSEKQRRPRTICETDSFDQLTGRYLLKRCVCLKYDFRTVQSDNYRGVGQCKWRWRRGNGFFKHYWVAPRTVELLLARRQTICCLGADSG